MIHYNLYGNVLGRGLTHEELLKLAQQERDVFARAELSGSEGCYVEVARWAQDRQRWERFCFEKVFGGEHPQESRDDPPSAEVTAERLAREINDAGNNAHISFIHGLPDWKGE